MKTTHKKVSDMTVDELKNIIHEVIADDIETWKETFEIMADKKLSTKLKKADTDWKTNKKETYLSWDELKGV